MIGALLGTQSNREVSVVNSFELIYAASDGDADVAVGDSSESRKMSLNTEFLENRKDQCKTSRNEA